MMRMMGHLYKIFKEVNQGSFGSLCAQRLEIGVSTRICSRLVNEILVSSKCSRARLPSARVLRVRGLGPDPLMIAALT
jgi:hypothetical protein